MLHIRKNDQVVVLSGREKGSKGKVLIVFPKQNRAIVEGLNMLKRHTRPNPQKNIKGGVVEKEAPIHLSNLMLISPESGKPVRVGFAELTDGRKIRKVQKTGETID